MELDDIIKKIDKDNNLTVNEETIIAVSNSYITKYYLDERLDKSLTKELKDGLKFLMIALTEENGGILECRYDDKSTMIHFFTYKDDNDFLYDEIGANLHLRKMERENEEFFENLALYCKMKFHQVDKVLDKEHNHHHNCNHDHN